MSTPRTSIRVMQGQRNWRNLVNLKLPLILRKPEQVKDWEFSARMYVNASGLENTQCVAILNTLLEKDAREFYRKQIELRKTFRKTEELLKCFESKF